MGKKTYSKLKEPVRIRVKDLQGGNKSLYLDMYLHGKRKKEGLKLYLVPEVNAATKEQNRNTMRLAEQIKAQRILDIQKVGMVDWEKVKKTHITLKDFCVQFEEDKNTTDSMRRARKNAVARVNEYLIYINKEELLLSEVDKDFILGFAAFLKTCTYNNGKKSLSGTTQRSFLDNFGSLLEMGVREGLLTNNPYKLVATKEKPKKDNKEREFLTIDEVKKLIETDCRYPIVKKMFLFSCFTGLRYSDALSLKWDHIKTFADGKGQYIDKNQIKTLGQVTVPISEEAKAWMPEKVKGKDTIFHELTITSTTVEVVLEEWMKAAKIDKHITYHCSRHTYATMLLSLGANLYVVSKLLGHKSIRMTEIYAKIVDQQKINTTNMVNNMFTIEAVDPTEEVKSPEQTPSTENTETK